MSLTMEQKAELFDYLTSRASEINMQLSFGGATFEGKAGEFDRHLALVLNKLEG